MGMGHSRHFANEPMGQVTLRYGSRCYPSQQLDNVNSQGWTLDPQTVCDVCDAVHVPLITNHEPAIDQVYASIVEMIEKKAIVLVLLLKGKSYDCWLPVLFLQETGQLSIIHHPPSTLRRGCFIVPVELTADYHY